MFELGLTISTIPRSDRFWLHTEFYLYPLEGVHPSHLKTPPDYTLPAPPLEGSPCKSVTIMGIQVCTMNEYYNMFAFSELFYLVFLDCLLRS